MIESENKSNANAKPGGGAARVAPIFRLFPSLTDIAFLAPILLLFLRLDGVKTMLGDGDTGWHIRAGEWILANGRVPETDMFSYTRAGEPWYAWEWLADIILGALHLKFGLAGPVYLGIVLLSVTSVLLFRLCRRHTNNDLIAIAVTAVAVGASSIHWLARPHLFTMVLLVVSLNWIDRSFANPRILWFFPPLVVLWTNLHGAFFLSIILLATVGAGLAVRELLSEKSAGFGGAWAKSRMYFASAAGCGLASLVNPYGWKLHQHIYEYLTERYHFDHILEFQTMSFHSPTAMFFEALMVAGLLAAAWSANRRRFADALLLLSWIHLSLVAARNIPLYAIISAPLITRFLSEAFEALEAARVAPWLRNAASTLASYGLDFSKTDRIWRIHVTSAAGLLVLLAALAGAPADSRKLRSEFDPKQYPAAALSKLDGRRVFTNDEWGDYLIYKLYPKTKVFVDGRSDFYGGKFSLRYLDALNGHWEWESILSEYKVDTVLLPANAGLAATLKASSKWRAVYDDQVSIVFYAAADRTQRGAEKTISSELVSQLVSDRRAGLPSPGAISQPKPQL